MAEPRYSVTVTFDIGSYVGEWTGNEERMPQQYTVLCQSPSKKYAELLYKSLIAGHGFVFQEPPATDAELQQGGAKDG